MLSEPSTSNSYYTGSLIILIGVILWCSNEIDELMCSSMSVAIDDSLREYII